MKFSNFCGIFATLFVTTTMVLLASCSQDDDNYDSDMYTLAEMGTRLGGEGGNPGGGGSSLPMYYLEEVTETACVHPFIDVVVTAKCLVPDLFTNLQPQVDTIIVVHNNRVKSVQIKDYHVKKRSPHHLHVDYIVHYKILNDEGEIDMDSLSCSHRFEFTMVDSLHPGPQNAPLNNDNEIETNGKNISPLTISNISVL